jgi:lipopolysaccharide export system permease protein
VITLFDRYLLVTFIRSFLICSSSMVGLYIVIDAFCNLDEFSESRGLAAMLATMGQYYLFRTSLFFDRLAGVITTLSAMFTFSWIQRTNELMPLLAAGVPIYRVIAPVLIVAMMISGLASVNQEFVIPRIAEELRLRPDSSATRWVSVNPTYDSRGILFASGHCYRRDQSIRPASITLPPHLAGAPVELRAGEATYVPPGAGDPSGGWRLTDVAAPEVQIGEAVLQQLGPDEYFLHTTITFDQVSRESRWYQFSSSRELLAEMRNPYGTTKAEMEVLVHTRLTKPLAMLTLLLLGLPFVLSGMDRRMISLVSMSLVVSLAFQSFCYLCQRLGNVELIPPSLAAWLPVMVFGTLAFGMFDLIKT